MTHGSRAIVAAGIDRSGSGAPSRMSLAALSDRLSPRQLAVLSLLAGVALLVAAVYWDSYLSMARVWRSTQYSHGILVFPVAAFLVWRLRDVLAGTEIRPSAWGIVPMSALVLLWYVGAAIGVQVVEQLAVVLLISATVVAVLGWPMARTALFPLLFAAAAVPIGDGLVPYLMETTADLSTALLRASGVPVFRQGQFLSLPGGNFEIADVCAGMQYLTAGTIIGLLFAYLTYRSYAKRAVFVAIMVVTMIVTNSVRAFIVMLVASATDMRYFVGPDHVYFGWILFALVVAALIVVAGRLSDLDDVEPAPGREQERGPGMLAAHRPLGASLAVGGAVVVLASGPVMLASRPRVAHSAPPVLALPLMEACDGPAAWAAAGHPVFESPDAAVSGSYRCSGIPVNAFVAMYQNNVQGREVVARTNRLIPETWRQVAAAERRTFTADDGQTIEVKELQLEISGARSVAWYWYRVGDETVTSEAAVKFTQALQMVIERRADGSAYLFQTPLDTSIESTRERLAEVARAVAPTSRSE